MDGFKQALNYKNSNSLGKPSLKKAFKATITITFSEQAVGGVGDSESLESKEEAQEAERLRQEGIRRSERDRRERYRRQEEEREQVITT